MATLIADRFLRLDEQRTIDVATGHAVVVNISPAERRAGQQVWTDACARLLGVPKARTLIDFGLVHSNERFEAYRPARLRLSRGARAPVAIGRHAVAQTVEWLEEAGACSPRILYVNGGHRGWLEGLAREVRLRGFIPLNILLLADIGISKCLPLVSGRAVALLDERSERGGSDDGNDSRDGDALSSAFVTLLMQNARDVAAVVHAPSADQIEPRLHLERTRGEPLRTLWRGRPLVARAAESRDTYGSTRPAPSMADPRAMSLLDEARRSTSRGRHAASERALRAAFAAFDRRNDLLHAGDAALLLGRLQLDRGRAGDARSQFDAARDRFQELGAAGPAARACVFSGLAQTDAGAFEPAERTLRAAYSAASALQDREAVRFAGVALARNMYWQERFADALAILAKLRPDQPACPRYWCLMSRLRLAAGNVDEASRSIGRAKDAVSESTEAAVDAVIRLAQARIQARLGDVDALTVHVREGLAAARRAHLPLAGFKLRLAFVEGLLNAGLLCRARAAANRMKFMGTAPIPSLLRRQVDRIAQRLVQGESNIAPHRPVAAVHETAPAFPAGQIDRVTELLLLCHDVEDERAALNAAAASIRKQTAAQAAGIFGAVETGASPFGVAGGMAAGIARRSIDLTYAIAPERGAAGFEAAVPIRHLGQTVGAIACRWTVEGPRSADDALGFMRLAAAACAPLVQIMLVRDSPTPQETDADNLELIGSSAGIREVRHLVARAASAPFTVLIEGESGSGKELVARAIHRTGCRRERRFCALNCAALTEELVDAELFGHVKGAFTGAASDRLGLFESADQGTVFLDEVGELSARAQAKLLRVLQEGEIRRIGENFTRPVDARLVAATNRVLRAEAEAGRFRQDLLYRLDVIRIAVPPLRERVDDIPLLAARFWRQAAERIGSKAVLGHGALSALARYDWPGNVRELQNVLTSLAVSVPSRGVVCAAAMPAAIARSARPASRETLDTARRHFDERFVRAALARSAGHRGQTAAALGVSRQGLAKLMHRLQI